MTSPTPAAVVRPADVATGDADVAACRDLYAWYVAHSVATLEEEAPDLPEMRRRMEASLATHAWLVAEVDGEVVAYAYGGPHRPRAGYRFTTEVSVYVAPGHARRGLGRALYVPLLDRLARQGYRLALAGVTLPNDASAGLHEGLGFRRVATFPGVGWKHDAWHDTGWWALELSPPRPA